MSTKNKPDVLTNFLHHPLNGSKVWSPRQDVCSEHSSGVLCSRCNHRKTHQVETSCMADCSWNCFLVLSAAETLFNHQQPNQRLSFLNISPLWSHLRRHHTESSQRASACLMLIWTHSNSVITRQGDIASTGHGAHDAVSELLHKPTSSVRALPAT